MLLEVVITEPGRAALVNARNNGTAPTLMSEMGLSATHVWADPALTELEDEFKRIGAIGGQVVADDTIQVSAIDASADTYVVRSFALYLDDGTLFAIYGQADPILDKAAASMAALLLTLKFADIDAAAIDFGDIYFSNPPATTERLGVVELATLAEARAGVDQERALTPYTGKNSVLEWLGFIPVRTDDAFGVGQTWQNFIGTNTRLCNTPYTNETTRPVMISLAFADGRIDESKAAYFEVSADGGATWVQVANAMWFPVYAVIPAGHTYRLRTTGYGANPAVSNNLIRIWSELR